MNDTLKPPASKPPVAADYPAPTHHRLTGVRLLKKHLFGVRVVLSAMLVLALLYTLVLTQSLCILLMLAVFISLALNPIVATAARRHVPRSVTAVVLMVALGGGVGTGITWLAQPAAEWLQRAPQALHDLAPTLKPVTEQINAATKATQSLIGPGKSVPQPATHSVFTAWNLMQMTPEILASVLAVVLLVFFFLIYGDTLLRRLVEISPTFATKRINVTLVRNIQIEVSRYLLTTALINTTLGAITAAWLWSIGVSDPLLWGGLVALANFIPYLGAVTMGALLLLVGLLQFDGLWHSLLPAIGFTCLSVLEGNVFTPMILGRRLRLSPVAILIWLLIWGWMWGIPGALMAVPMLTIVKLITEQLPGWRWFALMVGRGPPD